MVLQEPINAGLKHKAAVRVREVDGELPRRQLRLLKGQTDDRRPDLVRDLVPDPRRPRLAILQSFDPALPVTAVFSRLAAVRRPGSSEIDVRNRHSVVAAPFPRANACNSQPTKAAPQASAAASLRRPGAASVTKASTASATLTAKTCTTTSPTVKPRSVAR